MANLRSRLWFLLVAVVISGLAVVAGSANENTPPSPPLQGGMYFDSTYPKEPTTMVVLEDTIRSAKSPADSISTASAYGNYKYVKGTFKNLGASSGDTVKLYYVSQTGDTSLAGFWKNGNTTGIADTILVLGTGTYNKTIFVWMDQPFPFRVLAVKVSSIANSGIKATWEFQNDR